MNSKIIEKLEYNRIIKQLSDLAITAPAKEQALIFYELKDQCR